MEKSSDSRRLGWKRAGTYVCAPLCTGGARPLGSEHQRGSPVCRPSVRQSRPRPAPVVMKVLLINPPSPEQLGSPLLGLQYVAASLLAHGCEVRIVDAAARHFAP